MGVEFRVEGYECLVRFVNSTSMTPALIRGSEWQVITSSWTDEITDMISVLPARTGNTFYPILKYNSWRTHWFQSEVSFPLIVTYAEIATQRQPWGVQKLSHKYCILPGQVWGPIQISLSSLLGSLFLWNVSSPLDPHLLGKEDEMSAFVKVKSQRPTSSYEAMKTGA